VWRNDLGTCVCACSVACWIPNATRTHAQICNAYCLSTARIIRERASMLRYTYVLRMGVCMRVRVPLLIQCPTRMRHIVTSFMARQAPPYFSTLSQKRHDFPKKVTEHKMCVLIYSTNFVFLILKRIQWDIVIIVKSLHVKYTLLLTDFNETCIFCTHFRKKLKYRSSSKSS
jgi:hypothetical protein